MHVCVCVFVIEGGKSENILHFSTHKRVLYSTRSWQDRLAAGRPAVLSAGCHEKGAKEQPKSEILYTAWEANGRTHRTHT